MTRIFGVLCLSLLGLGAGTGCAAKEPISSRPTNNPDITYEVLFHHQGCEVGRFEDAGQAVYVTVCPEKGTSATMTSWVAPCGDPSRSSCWVELDRQQVQIRAPGDAVASRQE